MIADGQCGAEPLAKTILIIDDDPIVREIASNTLTDAGYRVVCVESGDDVMNVAWEESPDAVLLDCGLPGKPGMVVLEDLRASARFESVPIAMLTARRSEWSEKISRANGANAYLRKPFRPVDLLIEVAKLTR